MKTARLETAGIVLGFTGVLVGLIVRDTNMVVVGSLMVVLANMVFFNRKMTVYHAELLDAHTLRETCSCGASIQVPRDVEISADFLVQWRKFHHHNHHISTRS